MNLVDQIARAAAQAGKTTEELLTEEFRSFAVELGWPQEVANLCTVSNDGYAFTVTIQGESVERVLDWEMGTQDRLGIPAAHRFMERLDRYADEYSDNLLDALGDNGVI